MEERLQKVMAHAGVASRRTCEEMIQQGRVRVNGKVVSELGTKVDPQRDIVMVDGNPITGPEAPRYIVLYKPTGYLSAMEPEGGRPCLADLVKLPQRLYPVGRLDLDSEGLMLLTNDGELAHRLTHPRYQQPKEYLVLIEGRPSTIALRKLRQGVDVADRLTAPADVTIVEGPPAFLARPDDSRPIPTTWLHMVLREGRKREIRHMTAAVGHPTLRLIRIGLGPLRLERMKPGHWRDVNGHELRALRRLLRPGSGATPRGQTSTAPRSTGRRPPPRGTRPERPGPPGDRPRASGGQPSRPHAGRPTTHEPSRATTAPQEAGDRPTRGKAPASQDTARPPRPGGRPGTARPRRTTGTAPDQGARPPGPRDRPSGHSDRPPRGSDRPTGRGDRPDEPGNRPPARGDRPTGPGNRPPDRGNRATGRRDRPPGAPRGGRPQRRTGKKRPPL